MKTTEVRTMPGIWKGDRNYEQVPLTNSVQVTQEHAQKEKKPNNTKTMAATPLMQKKPL